MSETLITNEVDTSSATLVTSDVVVDDDHKDVGGVYLIIWSLYVATTVFNLYQVLLDRRTRYQQQQDIDHGGESATSSGDTTRQLFYRLLLFALSSRVILFPIPLLLSSIRDLVWIAITFPLLTFASAWTLLVTFLVQLVGTAGGDNFTVVGSNNNNTIILLQMVVPYGIFVLLAIIYHFNRAASLLMYALLCCIYTTLLCTILYFGPKLWQMLRPNFITMTTIITTTSTTTTTTSNGNNRLLPSQQQQQQVQQRRQHQALAIRLLSSLVLLVGTLMARTIGLAIQVLGVLDVIESTKIRPWWDYVLFEILPSLILLIMMHPSSNQSRRGRTTSTTSSDYVIGTPNSIATNSSLASSGGTSRKHSPITTTIIPTIGNNNNMEGSPLLLAPNINDGTTTTYGATVTSRVP